MIAPWKFGIVQTRGGCEVYANAISNTDQFPGHVASWEAVEHLQRHDAAHHTVSEIHPCLTGRLNGGLFLCGLNRALPTHTACVPGSRIVNRNDNHAAWDNPVRLKGRLARLANTTASVSHARARAKGFRWVQVSRGTGKHAHGSSEICRASGRTSTSLVGVCSAPAEPNLPSLPLRASSAPTSAFTPSRPPSGLARTWRGGFA